MSGKEYIDKMEEHQYANIYESEDVPFKDLSQGTARGLVYYGIGLFVLLILLSCIIKVPREVHIPFELKGGLNETIYQFPELIYIEDYFVQPNDTIKKGDTLAKITSPKIVKYIEEYESWKGKKDLYLSYKKEANLRTINLLETTIRGLHKEIADVKNERDIAISAGKKEAENLQLQVLNAEKQHKRSEKLHEQKVISDSDLEATLLKVRVAEQELMSRKDYYALEVAEKESQLQQLYNTKKQQIAEIEKLKAQFNYELATIDKNLGLTKKKLELNYGNYYITDNSIVLLSTVNGKVSHRSENEYKLPSNEILMRIKTSDINYYAYAEASVKDVGHVKNGTNAVLKYKSFPHYYYGTMHAQVLSVSSSPTENGNFPVKLVITNTKKLESRVTKGMTGTASFVVEEHTIINFIWRSFLKVITIEDS